jgi:hypothetical protein
VGVCGQRHSPAALPPGKQTLYTVCRRLFGLHRPSGSVWKVSSPAGFDDRTIQFVASCHADWAIPHLTVWTQGNIILWSQDYRRCKSQLTLEELCLTSNVTWFLRHPLYIRVYKIYDSKKKLNMWSRELQTINRNLMLRNFILTRRRENWLVRNADKSPHNYTAKAHKLSRNSSVGIVAR